MTSIYVVQYHDAYEDHGLVRSFTTPEEAKRYAKILNDESDDDIEFFTTELGLYNKCEDIDG